ncbi:MAG TPA: PilT/PilU family type 4a pilus ATPase [Thermoanaerobaculia bacterium]|nr:PilT/PilU family type 4a pilus ATPase [Thermoanaerobaculia bacterium]
MDETDDINRLIRELNADRPGAGSVAGEPSEAVRLDHWLEDLVRRAGSDLLLVAGAAPALRIDGRVTPLEAPPLSGDEIEEAVLPALAHHARALYRETGIADASHRVRGVGRFRINLHRERGRAAATVRALPTQPPRLGSLGLPPGAEALTRLPRGLVLVGGPTGAGKTTTLAALVEEINRRNARHIVTIEDPVEYEHPHRSSLVEQIEIGVDAPDFPTALRAAMRQAPDVIVVGEMRDPETMRIALAAAETGHLVFSTVHTTDVASTVSRVADSFPAERQNTIRQELSMSLAAVLTQTLLPRKGGGRAAAAELLFVSYGARQHIRKNALQHLHQEIALTRKQGSITLEESLAKLARDGVVDLEDARARAAHPEEFENYYRGA